MAYIIIIIVMVFIVSDTAGLRLVDDPIEEEGIRRALQRYIGRHVWTNVILSDNTMSNG